jgi:hypothetical protein
LGTALVQTVRSEAGKVNPSAKLNFIRDVAPVAAIIRIRFPPKNLSESIAYM